MKQYIFNGSIRTLVSQWLADTGFAQTQENVERVSASLDRQPFMPTSLYVGSLVELPETYTVEDLEKTSVASKNTTVDPKNTTVDPKNTTVDPKNTTADPKNTTANG